MKNLSYILFTLCISFISCSKSNKNETQFTLDNYHIHDSLFTNPISMNYIFKNRNSNESIFIELYTDKHRMYTFHFFENNIPPNLEKWIKQTDIQTTVLNDNKYFISKKGLKLNLTENEIINILGNPNQKESNDTLTKYTWGKPLNKMEIYFIDNKAIAIGIYRDLL